MRTHLAQENHTATFEVVAELGKLLGLNKSASLALALLFLADEPLSLDEIAARIGIAKSTCSVILGNLQQTGLIETVDRPRDRHKFYELIDNPGDVFALLIAQRLESAAGRQQNPFVTDRPDDTVGARSDRVLQRLNQLKSIHTVLLQFAILLRTQRAQAWQELSTRLHYDPGPTQR